MATGVSDVSALNSLFSNIFEDAVFAVTEQTIATRLVRNFNDALGTQTRTISEYPTVTPQQVAEGDDFSAPTKFTKTTLSTLTPAKYMAQFILTDERIDTDQQNAREDAAIALSNGFADNIDSNILSNFSSLTGGTVGASGSTMTWGYLMAAIAIMRGNKVPRPWYAVLHPYHWADLGEAAAVGATVTNAPSFQDEVMRSFYVGSVLGVDLFFSANCKTSGSDAYSAVFNPNAIAFDLRKDLTLEWERDTSKTAWELNMHCRYAHGVWRPTWGVQIIADATTPA